ncbi:imidazole glycerol phosphate synthase subunit HisH [Phenylobacterium sp.]|uniref:imidazole glycerol phosphate synthase subunit HisH n=1 Tax=Phenylobacterium sp. TaxID=1871053 RepID=UPI0025E595CA|nr:imidazole glycerol phosphate synthase subunit HisH [Phenylobacterium sp.]MCA6264759.1 imidazole glycerol phosphate synthase subunit HisH [Phenylobacterium sp.]MCA6317507.1 imidazole glycerol phosphate synthase subunit HisH [Phenylobacterium sp.]
MSRLALIDYGSGNLRSAEKALVRAARGRVEVQVTHVPEDVLAADRIVLPGVGAFAACKSALDARPGLSEALDEAVRGRGRPFLGICVGMQLMASRGLEFGETPGLGWIPGEVRRLRPADATAKVPHMGWNDLVNPHGPELIAAIGAAPMYFTHSFAFWPDDAADVAAEADHGGRFPAAVVRENMAGVQFHPEKSQSAGLALLSRFLEWHP